MGSEVSIPAIDEIINNVAGNATLGDVWALFQYPPYRDWETDRKSTRLNSSHITRHRMPSSA